MYNENAWIVSSHSIFVKNTVANVDFLLLFFLNKNLCLESFKVCGSLKFTFEVLNIFNYIS